jgi:hypothetical protein
MLDVQTIISLLAGGAIAKLSGLGGQVVGDAYQGLKVILSDAYGFAKGHLIEAHPKDQATLRQAEEALPPAAVEDPTVIAAARRLEEALKSVPEQCWRDNGVVIEYHDAGRDFRTGPVNAGRSGVRIRSIHADRDIVIGEIKG